MARVINIPRMDTNKKGAGKMIKNMAMVKRIKVMVIGMKGNMKMTYKMVRVHNIVRMDANKKGAGRMAKSMIMA